MQRHWESKGFIAIPVIQRISKMMLLALAWLHQSSVAHRDLKGDNFLMDTTEIEDPSCRIFLSDFGTAREILPGERLSEKCGTQVYWAPEFYDLNYSLAVDVWAVGVITFGLVTKRYPFRSEGEC